MKASFTVEAAFVLPLFLFAMLAFLGIFQAIQVQCAMSQALQYSARKLAAAYVVTVPYDQEGRPDESIAAEHQKKEGSEQAAKEGTQSGGRNLKDGAVLAAGRTMVVRYLHRNGCWTDAIMGGTAGISFLGSDASGDYVSLQADYRIRLPVTVWRLKSLPVSQGVRARKWIGATNGSGDGTGDADAYVYVTEHGTVYHISPSCPYLDLSIHASSLSDVSKKRNRSGGKYYPCSCFRHNRSQTVYITDYGTEYHSSLGCSHLTRTVHRVEKGEIGSMHACSKCAGGGS